MKSCLFSGKKNPFTPSPPLQKNHQKLNNIKFRMKSLMTWNERLLALRLENKTAIHRWRIFSDRMTNLFTHIDKCLLKWIWFNTNRRYKWHCCLLLFLAWLIPESVYNDAFRTFTFSMQQCIVYMTNKIRIILINFRFQIGNDRQSKRLLANLGRILFFSFFFG